MQSTLAPEKFWLANIKSIIASVDKDHSGSVKFDEFLDLMTDDEYSGSSKSEMREAFAMFDQDRNGFICASELQSVTESLGKCMKDSSWRPFTLCMIGMKLKDDEIAAIMEESDLDGDKNISFEEYIIICT